MRFVLAGLFVLLFAQSASAAVTISCRPEPEPLLLPIAEFQALEVEAAKKRLSDTFNDIKLYQEGLKVYRECLQRAGYTLQTKAAEKGQPINESDLQKLDSFWNATVEQEERLVRDFNALRGALCSRGVPEYCN
jgi:hypothetical protein